MHGSLSLHLPVTAVSMTLAMTAAMMSPAPT